MATKTPQEQLVALFNTANSGLATPLTVSDVDFGAVSNTSEGSDKNSTLTITAKAASINFSGSKALTYNRLAIALGTVEINDDVTNWDTDAEVLAHFNTLIQQTHADDAFVAEDITFTSAANADDASKTDITVTIKAGHTKFLPGEAVKWTIAKAKTDLSGTEGNLDGFN